jgi:hypothetical protein
MAGPSTGGFHRILSPSLVGSFERNSIPQISSASLHLSVRTSRHLSFGPVVTDSRHCSINAQFSFRLLLCRFTLAIKKSPSGWTKLATTAATRASPSPPGAHVPWSSKQNLPNAPERSQRNWPTTVSNPSLTKMTPAPDSSPSPTPANPRRRCVAQKDAASRAESSKCGSCFFLLYSSSACSAPQR